MKEPRLQVMCSNCFYSVNSHSCVEPPYVALLSVGRQQLVATVDLVPLLELAFPQLFAQAWWLVKTTVQMESICDKIQLQSVGNADLARY